MGISITDPDTERLDGFTLADGDALLYDEDGLPPLIVDSSALLAVVLAEPEAEEIAELLLATPARLSAAHARLARLAYGRYGRGSGSPAALNYGDRFSYALAKSPVNLCCSSVMTSHTLIWSPPAMWAASRDRGRIQ